MPTILNKVCYPLIDQIQEFLEILSVQYKKMYALILKSVYIAFYTFKAQFLLTAFAL